MTNATPTSMEFSIKCTQRVSSENMPHYGSQEKQRGRFFSEKCRAKSIDSAAVKITTVESGRNCSLRK